METDLLHMGISSLADLRDRDVDALVRDYCRQTGRPLDPALRPCFASLVAFAKTGATTAWWFLARAEAFRDREQVLARTG